MTFCCAAADESGNSSAATTIKCLKRIRAASYLNAVRRPWFVVRGPGITKRQPRITRCHMRTRSLCTIIFCASFIACGGNEKGTAGGGGAADKNTLVMALTASPTNLDSRVGNDNPSGRMFDLIYEPLLNVTPNMDYAPSLAEKWETPDDKTLAFHLNPNAKFHSGQPVKAADVKWTYDSLMASNFVSSKKSG